MRRFLLAVTLLAVGVVQATTALAEGTIRVAYAGSMGVVMDRFLGPEFGKTNSAQYEGIGQGSYGLARLLAAKQIQADVFVSVTDGPIRVLEKAGLVDRAVPIASTQMVIAYSPKSRFATQLKAAADGKPPWWQVLETPGLRFGRTDPTTDPQGRNIIFTMLLAQRYYRQPDLVSKTLGPYQNPAQIFSEPSLLSRLESGQLDASSGYQSATKSHHLPYILLPDEINLSNPAMDAAWYSKAHFTMTLRTGKGATLSPEPLVFYAAVLKNAPDPSLAAKFVQLLQSPEGQKALQDNGYAPPSGGDV
jgi:molybdate/tungstate transport system substrate-binding protein